jgi:hypothetical protein
MVSKKGLTLCRSVRQHIKTIDLQPFAIHTIRFGKGPTPFRDTFVAEQAAKPAVTKRVKPLGDSNPVAGRGINFSVRDRFTDLVAPITEEDSWPSFTFNAVRCDWF